MNKYSIYDELSREIMGKQEFRDKYQALLKHQYIGTRHEAQLELEEIKFLLQVASIFSQSFDEFKQIAYKIASIISLNYSDDYDQLNRIVQYIFISLGQLPVVSKNIADGHPDYFSIYSDSDIPFNPMQFKAVLFKQIFNQIPIEFDLKTIYLTDFQRKIYSSLSQRKSISISAPTSSGKSFLLKAFISKKFRENKKFNVIYIVPTRALISEVTRDFRINFKHFGAEDINISSSGHASNSKDKILPKKMFVLTQERYHNLLFDAEFGEPIDILIIDEAQKVSDGSRGIILEEVIEESLERYPNLQIIFISPFSKNPEKFAKIFHLENLQTEKTKLSPVSQNLFLINVNETDYNLNLSTVEFDKIIPISNGEIKEDEKYRFVKSDDWKLLWAAKQFGKEFNIVYCNSPRACLSNAQVFASFLPERNDPEIKEAISFLKENIHEEYFLSDCLKRGVAYHHGKIPNQIRNIIEDLFREKKLNYIFCTSTLLEGVNFPVQNIFIKNPKKGTSMDRLSFWNLAGRAGRLLKDYYGNIYCVNIEEWSGYKPDPRDVEHEIESVLESTFINKNKEIMEYLKDVYFNLKIKNRPIEQAITKFIIQELKSGKTNFIQDFIKRNPQFEQNKIQAISSEIENLAKDIELPAKILQKNSSIDPRKQQKLLDFFENNNPIIPIHPTQKGFLDNLTEIYKFINEFFMNKNEYDGSYRFYAPLTRAWIDDKSMNDLIRFKLYNLQKKTTPTPGMINIEIEKLFEDINDTIRYEYQKYLKCYIDVLLYYYEKSGYDAKNICENLPMYIEFGSFRKNVLVLQSIGLSRATSIAINSFTEGDLSNEVECLKWLKINKEKIRKSISPIYYKEISKLV